MPSFLQQDIQVGAVYTKTVSCVFMSAIVAAGGVSKRLGQNKGLVPLAETPLIIHVLDRLTAISDEIVVVVSSTAQERRFNVVLKGRARVIRDNEEIQTPLAGALTGFKSVQHDHSLLLACDTPFLSRQALGFLLEKCRSNSAAIPRWPNGNLEPLHAAYDVRLTAEATERALQSGRFDMCSMIANMTNVRYVPTATFREFDPKLITFFNVNTPNDLEEAEQIMKRFTGSMSRENRNTSGGNSGFQVRN